MIKVLLVNPPFLKHLVAVEGGGVDAAMTMEPSATMAMHKGGFRD